MVDSAFETPIATDDANIMARKLRIAVSVFFGLATVALCVLWIMSYWRVAVLTRIEGHDVVFKKWGFNDGCFVHTKYPVVNKIMDPQTATRIRQTWPAGWRYDSGPAKQLTDQFEWQIDDERSIVVMPSWPVVLLTAVIGVFTWRLPRFSLRTLFLATALVAVVLGMAVWAIR